MTDATAPADNGQTEPMEVQGQPAGPGFRILAQYVRDLSFENPRAPESLRIEGKPAIDMGVEMNAAGRPDGLFALTGVAPQDIEPMLLIECPRYLFPFARQVIAQATSDGGFYPPFMVDPIDFAAIYVARQQQIAGGPAETGQA